jgi:membrane fusion protein, multidrug efflux system
MEKLFKNLIMKSKSYLILITLFFLAACSAKTEKNTSAIEENLQSEKVGIMVLENRKVMREIEYTATLQAFEELHLSPASPGRIEAFHVEAGDKVRAGQLLVEMDQTQLHQAEVQLRSLETDYRRLDTLLKTGSIAIQQYDQLKTQYEIAQSNVAFMRKNTRLLAPFSGTVSGKYFEAGEMFSGTPVVPIGKPAVLSLVQTDRLKAIISVSERFLPDLATGMEASLQSDVYPDRQFTGKVSLIYPTVDPLTRSFRVELLVANSDQILRPGMYGRVKLGLEEIDAILVPAISVLKMQGSNDRYMFIERDGKAVRIPVRIGKRYDDDIEVISDLVHAGDRIIIHGQARLKDGVTVEVTKVE